LKVFTTYLLGMNWVNCFKTHNKLTMYPLGKLPFAPSGNPGSLRSKRMFSGSSAEAGEVLLTRGIPDGPGIRGRGVGVEY